MSTVAPTMISPIPPRPPEIISWFWIHIWSVLPVWYQASASAANPATMASVPSATGTRMAGRSMVGTFLLTTLLIRWLSSAMPPLKPFWYRVAL